MALVRRVWEDGDFCRDRLDYIGFFIRITKLESFFSFLSFLLLLLFLFVTFLET